MRKHLKWLVPLAVVASVALILFLRNGGSEPQASETASADAQDGRWAAATIDDVSVQLSETGLLDITAPASDTVINLEIEEGEIVTSGAISYTSGTTLMTLADLSTMQIKAGINEVDIGKVRLDQEVAIDVDAYPTVRFNGEITHLATAARDEQGVKIFDVEIDIADIDERLREIGIRKAVGAPDGAVFQQFLVESVTISHPS